MLVDHSHLKLGLKPAKRGLKVPGMKRLGIMLPTAAPIINWSRAVAPEAWGMDCNDRWGCCTIAGAHHAQVLWHANCNGPVSEMTEAETAANYRAVSGFNPDDPSTDQGAMLSDVMIYWQRRGFAMGGNRDQATAFVHIDPSELNELRLAIQWFGAAVVGINMPVSSQSQEVWDVAGGDDGEPGSWGGHCVTPVGYDAHGILFVSWAKLMRMTWAFWRRYGAEAWAVLSHDWLEVSNASPAGINYAALQDDLAEL